MGQGEEWMLYVMYLLGKKEVSHSIPTASNGKRNVESDLEAKLEAREQPVYYVRAKEMKKSGFGQIRDNGVRVVSSLMVSVVLNADGVIEMYGQCI